MRTRYIIILLICLVSCNQTDVINESKDQLVNLLVDEKNLGEILNNKPVKLEIQFRNPSDKKVKIENFQGSCGCTDIRMISKEIKARSSVTASVIYDPKDDFGETKKKIMFRLSNGQLLTYTFLANVIKNN